MPQTRTIILVHTTLQNRNGCDPAIDLDAPGVSALLSAYQRTRSDEDRAAIPLREGLRPAEFVVQRLSQRSLVLVREAKSAVEQVQRAVLAGCHEYTDARGVTHKAKVSQVGDAALADDSWLDALADEYGGAAIDEIGHAITQWSMAPKSAIAPFGWAPGLVLAR